MSIVINLNAVKKSRGLNTVDERNKTTDSYGVDYYDDNGKINVWSRYPWNSDKRLCFTMNKFEHGWRVSPIVELSDVFTDTIIPVENMHDAFKQYMVNFYNRNYNPAISQ